MTDLTKDLTRLNELLDRHGSDFTRWPDAAEAGWARRFVLAEPQARRALDEARMLDTLLDERAASLVADEAMVERTLAAVEPAAAARRSRGNRRVVAALAACFLVAAVFGSAFAQFAAVPAGETDPEMAMLDSMLFGPPESDLP